MRLRYKVLGAAIVPIFAIYTTGWFVLAGRAEREILAELQAQKAKGLDITSGIHSVSGFPFALQVRLREFTVRTETGMTFEAPAVVAASALFTPSNATIVAPEGGLLTIAAGRTRGEIKVAIATADGTIGFARSDIETTTLTLHTASITGLTQSAGGMMADEVTLQIHKPPRPADHMQPALHATINVDGIVLPDAEPGLGNRIEQLQFDVVVMGQSPALDEPSLKAWRDDGGTLEIHQLAMDWGPVKLKGDGTLALDNDLQPIGSFSATLTGYNEVLSALAEQHIIRQTSAAWLSIALGLLARPEGIDATQTLHAPVSIQNREVYIASFKLTTMPLIRLY